MYIDNIYRKNETLERIVDDRFNDTVYAKLKKNGKLQLEGDFTAEDLRVLLNVIES